MHQRRPQKGRGRRECRVLAAPMARLQQNAGGSTTGSAETTRHSPRDGLRLIRDLPGVRALLATVALQIARKA